MGRTCYPPIQIPGTSLAVQPTAYWDFCTKDTTGQGSGSPVAWTHGAGVAFDNDGTPECVVPALYYDRSTTAKSEQDATLYRSVDAVWLICFQCDGAPAGTYDEILGKASPGTPGASQNGFLFATTTASVFVHLKDNTVNNSGYPGPAGVAISNSTGGIFVAAAFSVRTAGAQKYAVFAANGTNTSEVEISPNYSVGEYPLLLGNYTDTFWNAFKGYVVRVATWQGISATGAELATLTSRFSNGCTGGFVPANAMMFSCNT